MYAIDIVELLRGYMSGKWKPFIVKWTECIVCNEEWSEHGFPTCKCKGEEE